MNFTKYGSVPTEDEISSAIEKARAPMDQYRQTEVLKAIFSLLDLTTLNTSDGNKRAVSFTEKVNYFSQQFKGYPNVASICVYPSLVPVVRRSLSAEDVSVCSVSAGFPSSQTFIEVKKLETKMAIEHGATEIDIVISVGKYLDQEYDTVFEEIREIKETVGTNKLKVILETGELKSTENIYKSSMLAMEAGADFIKTSTGKVAVNATPEAACAMLKAISDFFNGTGKKVGFKPAGGISTVDDALIYYALVDFVLGKDWLNKNYFRIGASRLANRLLNALQKIETGVKPSDSYF